MALVVALVYFLVLKGRDEEYEEPTEMGPEPSMGMDAPSLEDDEEIEEEMEVEEIASAPSIAVPSRDEPEFEDEDDVQELEQLIEDLEKTEEEIQDLCPECGSPLGPSDTDCPSCGAEFELALECPNCGSVVDSNSSNCPGCGIQFV